MVIMVPPPPLVQKSCQNMPRMGETLAKKYWRTAKVSAHWFNATADKKHIYSLKKYTVCQSARWSAARRTSSNKIENELVSLKKIASLCCAGHVPPWNVGRSHSPINLKPLEAGGWGGLWCWCYMCCLLLVGGYWLWVWVYSYLTYA